MLREQRAHQQPAIRPALNGQLLRAGVVLIDQPSGGGRKIVEDVLLLGERPLRVPLLAKLAAAAQDGNRVDAAGVEEKTTRRAKEERCFADAVTAVSI